MHGFAALDPFQLCENSQTIRSGRGAGNPSRLAKQPLAAWPLQVGGDPTLAVRVQEVFPSHPRHVANAGAGQRPRCWQDPWGSRSRGQCAVGTHFKGFGGLRGALPLLQGTRENSKSYLLCSLAWLSGDRWAHVASVAKAAPCALRPLIT